MITQICSFLYKKNDNRYIRLLLLKIIAKIDGGFPFSNNIRQLYSEVQCKYLQPIITQYFIDNKSEIWLLFLIAHSKR